MRGSDKCNGVQRDLTIELEQELMGACLRECNINGFHERWKGQRTENVGQLCDVETTESGRVLRDVWNVQIVNIVATADLTQCPVNPEESKVPGNEKCLQQRCHVVLCVLLFCLLLLLLLVLIYWVERLSDHLSDRSNGCICLLLLLRVSTVV